MRIYIIGLNRRVPPEDREVFQCQTSAWPYAPQPGSEAGRSPGQIDIGSPKNLGVPWGFHGDFMGFFHEQMWFSFVSTWG